MSAIVGRQAPGFTAHAVMPDGTLQPEFSLSDLVGRYVVLLFYPLDFSFVCPTEILALDARLEEFGERDCAVIGVSVDSVYSHIAWRNTPVEQGGIGPIRFPLVSDLTKKISRDYGVLADDATALRATFLLDRTGIVQHAVVNAAGIGRSIEETRRTLDALRHVDSTGELCPANWSRGSDAIQGTPAGVRRFLKDFSIDPR